MFSLPYLFMCIYCMLQLSYLIVVDYQRRNVRSVREHYFPLMLVMLLLSFTADFISTLNHISDWFFPFAAAGNYFEIILNTGLLPIYFLYVCKQISNVDTVLKRRMNTILWILTVMCAVIVTSTAFNKCIFYFDQYKEYHRGPLFWLPMAILFIMMIIIEGFIISQKSKIEVRYFRSLILFLVFPMIGWVFQFFVYGMPFALMSAVFAAQVVFTSVQNQRMDTDYLTGVFNRQSLDNHIQGKIDVADSEHSFSAIMLDIDNFKSINDCFGHYEGDIALVNTVDILRNSVRNEDFIARYGGDEFCIVLNEDDPFAMDSVVERISSNLQEFNSNTKKPYQLNFSIGFAVYDPLMGNRTEMFIKVIDDKMYDDKKARKAAGENAVDLSSTNVT